MIKCSVCGKSNVGDINLDFQLYCYECFISVMESGKSMRKEIKKKSNWVKFKRWHGDIEFTFIDISKCSIYRIDDYKLRSEPNKNFCTINFYGEEGERQSLFIEESVEDVIKRLQEI